MENLWPRVEPLLLQVERPARYIDHEWIGGVSSSGKSEEECTFHFCMMYPDTYEVGQANQAVRILCNVVNATPGMVAERGFLPAVDLIELMRQHDIPLFSVEGCAPVRAFDAVGITLPHELCATNVLEMLDLAGISLHANERGEDDPFVIGGGPCSYNPEPFAAFFDAFSIGEGEEALPELLEVIRDCKNRGYTRDQTLRALDALDGVYVPALWEVCEDGRCRRVASMPATHSTPMPATRAREEATGASGPVRQGVACSNSPRFEERATGTFQSLRNSHSTPMPATRARLADSGRPDVVVKRVFEGFSESPAWEPCVVPYTEAVHDRLNVEILRGCARGCRFCQAGMMYRPVRERPESAIVQGVLAGLALTGYDEVSLTSLSSTDHSQIAGILSSLNGACEGKGVRISIPSQRLDSFGVEMAHLVAGQKKGGLTFAPEAGTQRLRDVINKNVTEDDLFSAVDAAFAAGWRRVKLYFMIGLPTETDEDIEGIARLAQCVYERAREACPPAQRGAIKVGVSVAVFVPKAHTPFQYCSQISAEEAQRRVDVLRHSVKYRAIDVNWHSTATSFIEAVMSRAGREAAAWIESAWKHGARFDAWSEQFNEEAWKAAGLETGFNPAQVAFAQIDTNSVLPWEHISTGVAQSYFAREYARALAGQTTSDCTFDRCTGCGACQALDADNMLAEPRRLIERRAASDHQAREGCDADE